MSSLNWSTYSTLGTAITTGMDGLADAGYATSTAVDFGKKTYLDIEVVLATVDLSAKTNPAIYAWVQARTDGTNFEDIGTTRPPDAIFPLTAASQAHRVFQKRIETTPDQGKIIVQNKTGGALAANSNTVKFYLYGVDVV